MREDIRKFQEAMEKEMGPEPDHHHTGAEWLACTECQAYFAKRKAAADKVGRSRSVDDDKGEKEKAERLRELLKLAFDPERLTKMKAAMFPATDVLRKAIESGELPLQPGEHRQTHKSQEELLACDICQGWEQRRDAILEKNFGPRK
jgi:hypothetical protein